MRSISNKQPSPALENYAVKTTYRATGKMAKHEFDKKEAYELYMIVKKLYIV